MSYTTLMSIDVKTVTNIELLIHLKNMYKMEYEMPTFYKN